MARNSTLLFQRGVGCVDRLTALTLVARVAQALTGEAKTMARTLIRTNEHRAVEALKGGQALAHAISVAGAVARTRHVSATRCERTIGARVPLVAQAFCLHDVIQVQQVVDVQVCSVGHGSPEFVHGVLHVGAGAAVGGVGRQHVEAFPVSRTIVGAFWHVAPFACPTSSAEALPGLAIALVAVRGTNVNGTIRTSEAVEAVAGAIVANAVRVALQGAQLVRAIRPGKPLKALTHAIDTSS